MAEETETLRSPREINYSEIPLLADLDRISLAELIPSLEQVHVKSGDILYRAGDPADAFYIIVEGIVRVFLRPGGRSLELACLGPGDWFGELALLTGEPRTTDVEAQTDLVLLKLSRETFNRLIKKYPSLAVSLAGLLAAKLASANVALRGGDDVGPRWGVGLQKARHYTTQPAVPAPRSTLSILFGWLKGRRFLALLLILICCLPSALFLHAYGLSTRRIMLFELLLAATVMWSTNAFSFHTVSMALPIIAVLLGITTPAVAFSGFSSSTWFLVLGVFGISAAVSKTGLPYRLTLLVMKRFPRNYLGQAFAVAFSGLLLTPVIPSPNGRLVLSGPLILTLTEILGYKKGSAGAVGLTMASFLGYGNMSFMFMNGSFVCFFMLGLLPADVGASVTWGYWFLVAWLLSVSFFCCSFLAIIALYRPTEKMLELAPSVTAAQLRTLGPLTTDEKVCILAVATSLVGFLTQSWHHIDGAWVAMLSFLILFGASVLDQNAVRTNIDWAFLISLGALISFGNVISRSGLPEIIAEASRPYLTLLVGSPFVFLPVVTVSVVVIRFILPPFPSLVVSILALLPISAPLEINPLVLGLIVLLANEPWLFPHQSMIFQTLVSSKEGRLLDHRDTLKLALLHVLFCVLAVACSIPYWQYMGLIR
ncbi:MAG: SLC13 family permease [candidate division WOR-3 bacterium]